MARAVIITSYLEYPLDIRSLLRPEDYIVCLDGGYDIAKRLDIVPDLVIGDFDSIREPFSDEQVTWTSDSIGFFIPDESGSRVEIRRYPPEKDYTDLELAFRTLDPEKYPELLVIGGLGGRLDQTLINVQMLQQYTADAAVSSQDESAAEPQKDSGAGDDPAASDSLPYGSPRQYRRITLMDGHHSCFVLQGGLSGRDSERTPEGSSEQPAKQSKERSFIDIPRQPDSYLSLLPLTEQCSGVDLQGVKYPLSGAVLRRGSSLSISNEFRADTARLRLASGSLLVVITRGNARDFCD